MKLKHLKEKEKPLEFPRVIEVKGSENSNWKKRVCIAIKQDKAICWNYAETLEEAENVVSTSYWNYWREIEEEPKEKYKPFDFSDGIEKYSYLLGKKIFYKYGGRYYDDYRNYL